MGVVEGPILKGYYNRRGRKEKDLQVVEGPILKGYYNVKNYIVNSLLLWKALF